MVNDSFNRSMFNDLTREGFDETPFNVELLDNNGDFILDNTVGTPTILDNQ